MKWSGYPNLRRTSLAAVAEDEQERISARTKAALAATKARGTRLGNPTLAEACAGVNAARQEAAEAFAAGVLPIIREIQANGATSLRGAAA
jgi:DNA invertase Pin-like site-specific DNA recombinase